MSIYDDKEYFSFNGKKHHFHGERRKLFTNKISIPNHKLQPKTISQFEQGEKKTEQKPIFRSLIFLYSFKSNIKIHLINIENYIKLF